MGEEVEGEGGTSQRMIHAGPQHGGRTDTCHFTDEKEGQFMNGLKMRLNVISNLYRPNTCI